ncbi:MAG: ATP-binding protein [Oscillospiraceae bacterium]|nr:ATP-binding protein [Oscillospiraceae bacterium]
MSVERFFEQSKRKIVITGHYGSGKTELTVSLAMQHAENSTEKLAVIDLDVVNPYFRSRERREELNAAGISVYGSLYDTEITAEMPALGATVRAPLEDSACRVLVDAGGNDSGALVLNQFMKYFTDGDTTVVAVLNANRPETRDIRGATEHISAIEAVTGLTISGIVNNCHLLRETTADTVIKGHKLCQSLCEESGKELLCDCYPSGIVDPDDLSGLSDNLVPMSLYMRPAWLDK